MSIAATHPHEQHNKTIRHRVWGAVTMAMSKTGLDDLGARDQDSMSITGGRVQLPQWLFLYLIAQIIGGVWWGATQQSDVKYLQAENVKLWQKIETHDLQLAKLSETVRAAVKEALDDSNYVRVRRKGE